MSWHRWIFGVRCQEKKWLCVPLVGGHGVRRGGAHWHIWFLCGCISIPNWGLEWIIEDMLIPLCRAAKLEFWCVCVRADQNIHLISVWRAAWLGFWCHLSAQIKMDRCNPFASCSWRCPYP
jgi:hypothetical protein